MTPEEERRIKIAAVGWQMRAERLKKENARLRTLRPLLAVAIGIAVVESSIVILLASGIIPR